MKKMVMAVVALHVFCGMAFADFSGNFQYRKKGSFGDLTIKEIGNGKATFKFDNSAGMNIGELEFEADIDRSGNVHYSKTDEFGDCELTMKVSNNKVSVNQVRGTCGAGAGVEFGGVYRKKAKK